MRRLVFVYFLVFIQWMGFAGATEISQSDTQASLSSPDSSKLSYLQALVLGTVQGITEFLPISSTGHLIIANHALSLDSEEALLNKDGQEMEYTMKEAADSYAVIIQGGTILAIMFLYWKRIWAILLGLMGRNKSGIRLARNIILAFLPAACLGLVLGSWIEEHLFSPKTVMIALIGGAILMLSVERWRRIREKGGIALEEGEEMDLDELTVRQSLTIGGLQCLAMWPGTSRSMVTIVGGYIAGLSPARAAEFSFLLGLVTLSAAAFYKIVTDGSNMAKVLSLGPAIFGCAIAFLTGAVAVKWLINYLSRRGLSLFAWYRIALAFGIFLVNYVVQ